MYRYPRPQKRDTRRVYLLAAMVGLFLMLPGGRNAVVAVNINERALVHAIGIDQSSRGYDLTLQVFQPTGSGSEGGVDTSQPNVETIRCSGETFDEALSHGSRLAGQELFLGHLRVICFGRDTDLSDPEGLLGTAITDKDIPLRLRLCVSDGRAGDIMDIRLSRRETSAEALENILENGERYSGSPRCALMDFLTPSPADGSFLLPLLHGKEGEKPEDSTIELIGSAVCKKGVVCTLTLEETLGAALLSGRAGHIPVTFTHEGRLMSAELASESFRVRFDRREGGYVYAPTMTLTAGLTSEVHDPETSDRIAGEIEDVLRGYAAAAVRRTLMSEGCDVIRLSAAYRSKLPAVYAACDTSALIALTSFDPDITVRVE